MNNDQLNKCFAAIRSGDKAAFESLYNDMKTPVFTVICRITADRAVAEDIMQDLFVKLYCSPPDGSVRNIRAWIFRIAHNMALDNVRKRRFEELPEEMQDAAVPLEDSVGLRLDIEKAMLQLSEVERETVSLHLNANLKFREIAEVLDVPVGTALWRYRSAIGKLQSILSGGTL